MNYLPNDLIHEIISRLPAKSIKRFRCVSKLWCSMLCSTYFTTELFLTRSSARPRLLLAVEKIFGFIFYSSPQHQNPYEKSSLVVARDFFSKDTITLGECSYVSGLIYFANMWNPNKGSENELVRAICNPSTGQHAVLPQLRPKRNSRVNSYLGFDPIDKQFKVLVMSTVRYVASNEIVHLISTLGTGETIRWRNIQCPFTHGFFGEGICINGMLYYKAEKPYCLDNVIVCFDVRSEQFTFIDTDLCGHWSGSTLINYKGKLGVIDLKYNGVYVGFPLKLRMWVLEDLEKQEWSTHFCTLGDENESVKVRGNLSVARGMTATGEIFCICEDINLKSRFVFSTSIPKRTLSGVLKSKVLKKNCLTIILEVTLL